MRRTNKHQIIIVDDNPDFTFLIERALNRCTPCPTVKVLHNGTDLLAWLETGQRPSLILLDIYMPGITGFELLSILKTDDSYKLIPVVMLSESEDKRDISKSYEDGANAYESKPVSYRALVTRMQLLSHYWFDVAKTPTENL
jgi:CheY-like chemotaxis protein